MLVSYKLCVCPLCSLYPSVMSEHDLTHNHLFLLLSFTHADTLLLLLLLFLLLLLTHTAQQTLLLTSRPSRQTRTPSRYFLFFSEIEFCWYWIQFKTLYLCTHLIFVIILLFTVYSIKYLVDKMKHHTQEKSVFRRKK